jgi:GNAT superfamily N-acetyltransferase
VARLIIVTAPAPRRAALARDFRQWGFELQKRISPKPTIEEAPTLAAVALDLTREHELPPIVVASGVSRKDLRSSLPQKAWPLCLLVGGRAMDCEPLATPLVTEPSNVRAPQPRHLEKLALLQGMISWLSIRPLSTVGEIQSYLSLRYRVWSSLGYTPEDRRCDVAQLEVDYSDRFSTALGAFAISEGREEFIGGIRIINEKLADNPQWKLIEHLLATKTDPNLNNAIRPAREHTYPFDLLASFPAFAETYRTWVRAEFLKAEVSRVVVEPARQGKGVGEVLVDSACAYARGQGLNLLFLACKQEHTPFYQRSGFQTLSNLHCDSFASVKVPAVGMVLNL